VAGTERPHDHGKTLAESGLRRFRASVKDTLAWWATVAEERRAKPRFIITPEIEARALLEWKRE